MEVRDLLLVVRDHWLAIIICIAAGAALAFGWTFTQPKVYSANSSGIFVVNSSSDIGSSAVGDSLSKSKATTYASVATSRAVAQRVIDDLGLSTSPESLVRSIKATVPASTPTIQISATASTAQGAKDLADAWIAALAQQVTQIETGQRRTASTADGSSATNGTVSIVPVESAVVPRDPISPNVRLAVLIGAIAGLVVGYLFGFIRSRLDRRIRSAEVIEKASLRPRSRICCRTGARHRDALVFESPPSGWQIGASGHGERRADRSG